MRYTLSDFAECLKLAEDRIGPFPSPPKHVHRAWGRGRGGARGLGSWEGGFLVELEDHSLVYVVGSCDYTGWG